MELINSKYLIAPKSQSTTKPQSTKLKLFYTNDWHGTTDNLGGVLGAALHFDSSTQGKNLDTLKLCAGDSWSGANAKKNSFIVNLLNYMRFDACAVGNHELDAGIKAFVDTISGSKHTKFLSSNIHDSNNQKPSGVQSSFVKEINGSKYGIIGLSPLDLKTVVTKERLGDLDVLNFDETVRVTQAEIDKLRSSGVNKIILLTHIGKDLDEKLASALDGVDIIVGGHSHDKIDGVSEGENLLRSKSGEPVIVLQTGQNAQGYGILNAEFSPEGLLTKVANSVIETNQARSSVVDKIRDDEVGVSPQIATLKEVDAAPENRRVEPSAWTALVADSMRASLGTDIAIINSANIRKFPQVGKLTERDVEESAPMKNELMKVELTQEQIVNAIKNAASRTMSATDGYPGLLQCSGLNYTIDSNGNLLSLEILDKNSKPQKIDINNPSKDIKYTVAMDSFLAGGKEYPELVPATTLEKFNYDKDKTAIDLINTRTDKDGLIIKDDGRLKIVQTLQPQQKRSNTRNI